MNVNLSLCYKIFPLKLNAKITGGNLLCYSWLVVMCTRRRKSILHSKSYFSIFTYAYSFYTTFPRISSLSSCYNAIIYWKKDLKLKASYRNVTASCWNYILKIMQYFPMILFYFKLCTPSVIPFDFIVKFESFFLLEKFLS